MWAMLFTLDLPKNSGFLHVMPIRAEEEAESRHFN